MTELVIRVRASSNSPKKSPLTRPNLGRRFVVAEPRSCVRFGLFDQRKSLFTWTLALFLTGETRAKSQLAKSAIFETIRVDIATFGRDMHCPIE